MPTHRPVDVLKDSETTDDVVADALADRLPQAIVVAFGNEIRSLLKMAAIRERSRCAAVIDGGRRAAVNRVSQIEVEIAAAVASAIDPGNLGIARHVEGTVAQSLAMAIVAIRTPPGRCPDCAGARVVPGAVVGRGGQPSLVPCGSCAAPPVNGAADENTAPGAVPGGG